MTKIVLFNGPRGVGKDTAARLFMSSCLAGTCTVRRMSTWKARAYAEYGLVKEVVNDFEAPDVKDEPNPKLKGKTPRQVLIEYGTRMRKDFGDTVFAENWKTAYIQDKEAGSWVLVPDVRFAPEVQAANEMVGEGNVILVNVVRPGCTWDNDIGLYLDHENRGVLINSTNDTNALRQGVLNLIRRLA